MGQVEMGGQNIPFVAAVACILSLGDASWAQTNALHKSALAVWDTSFLGTVGGGFRNNVLRSAVAPENSSFIAVAMDATLMRLSESGARLSFVVTGEDTRYLDAQSVEREQFFSVSASAYGKLWQRHEPGVQAQYFYQYQVVDASETEEAQGRVLVEGHTASLRPSWQTEVGQGCWVLAEGLVNRQLYMETLDDYWEGGGRLGVGWDYGRKSQLSLFYQTKGRWYDTRNQYDLAGQAEPGTSLTYHFHEAGGIWRHYWDAGRHWRTATRLSYLWNRDNGSGYFNYERLQGAEQVRWQNRGWEVNVTGRGGYYYYPYQFIAGEARYRTYAALEARVERRLSKHWFIYVAGEREWDLSNDPVDQYQDWMATGGLGAEF